MVFLPLALGALNPPKEAREALDTTLTALGLKAGEKPAAKGIPTVPDLESLPPAPVLIVPVPKVPDPERIRKIKSDIGYQDATEETLAFYLQHVEIENTQAKHQEEEAFSAATRRWDAICKEIEARNQIAENEHKEAVLAWHQANATYAKDLEAWEILKLKEDSVCLGFYEQFSSSVGCIWEDISKAGPRGINGYPNFFSFHIMSKPDWERAKVAIDRETQRAKEFEV